MIYSYIWLFILSALPLIESRIAIPIGILSYGLPIWNVLWVSLLGNITAVALLLWLLPIVTKFLQKRWRFFDRVLNKLFEKTRTKHSHKVQIWGDVFLLLFVAVPIPGSGGWGGALIAFVFGFPFWRSLGLISTGVSIAALLLLGASFGGQELFNVFAS